MKHKANLLMVRRGGGLFPSDEYSEEKVRLISEGTTIGVSLSKVRSPYHYRMAHKIGCLCANNLDDFRDMDYHRVLKKLQLETGIWCETASLQMRHLGIVQKILSSIPDKELRSNVAEILNAIENIEVRVPQSMAFDSMDEREFSSMMRGFCRHLSEYYWSGVSTDDIYQMAKDYKNAV